MGGLFQWLSDRGSQSNPRFLQIHRALNRDPMALSHRPARELWTDRGGTRSPRAPTFLRETVNLMQFLMNLMCDISVDNPFCLYLPHHQLSSHKEFFHLCLESSTGAVFLSRPGPSTARPGPRSQLQAGAARPAAAHCLCPGTGAGERRLPGV